MIFRFLIILTITTLLSCSKNKSVEHEIFESVYPNLIETFKTNDFITDSNNLYFTNEELRPKQIEFIKEGLRIMNKPPEFNLELTELFLNSPLKSSKLDFSSTDFNLDISNYSQIENFDVNKDRKIYVSIPNIDKEVGCFYTEIICGQKCSRGLLVFISRNSDGKWEMNDNCYELWQTFGPKP